MKGWGTRKRSKRSLTHSLTRSVTHNCKYFDTQVTVKKWSLASLYKFNYIQEMWVLHSGKLCSPSSYLHRINVLPNNSNSTVLCITKLCTMPVYVKGVHNVVFCNPVINLGRNHLRPILNFVNIFLVFLFKPNRKILIESQDLCLSISNSGQRETYLLLCNRLELFTLHS
jgi:hypothetical protein